ncbi:hypothetical protein [Mycobacterium sp. 155]|uniref:hypothetical protein n=1 Tax=Mycobacterium sp. 155 TaxID=1157943 RepID=UPI00037EADF7|nr:hypothetical protein [Mycobacterium sp. 155]
MTPNTAHAAIESAAATIVTAHVTALGPLVQIADRSVAHPPTIDRALTAVLHLNSAGPQLDHAVNGLLRELVAAGVSRAKLCRLLALRTSALTARLTATAPTAVTVPDIQPGSYGLRDKVSQRAARESLITTADAVRAAYLDALRPMATVSQGTVVEAATVDAAVEAVVGLRVARRSMETAVDQVLAALVLGGVKRMALAGLLGCSPATLQRRLTLQPLAHARWVDLVDDGDGVWTVQRVDVGKYSPAPEAADFDESHFDIEAAMNAAAGYAR